MQIKEHRPCTRNLIKRLGILRIVRIINEEKGTGKLLLVLDLEHSFSVSSWTQESFEGDML